MTKHVLAPALAFVALATATTAQAQQQACVAATDLGDSVIYAMPIAYDAVSATCAKQLKSKGFMATEGDAFIERFRAKQDSAWPGAFRLLKSFMAKEGTAEAGSGEDMAAMIASLPEASLRPFVDGIIGQKLAQEIKPSSCVKIERGMELLSPLPAENVAGLVAFILEIAEVKEPAICGVAATGKAK